MGFLVHKFHVRGEFGIRAKLEIRDGVRGQRR